LSKTEKRPAVAATAGRFFAGGGDTNNSDLQKS
jgi:hypothetical protein